MSENPIHSNPAHPYSLLPKGRGGVREQVDLEHWKSGKLEK